MISKCSAINCLSFHRRKFDETGRNGDLGFGERAARSTSRGKKVVMVHFRSLREANNKISNRFANIFRQQRFHGFEWTRCRIGGKGYPQYKKHDGERSGERKKIESCTIRCPIFGPLPGVVVCVSLLSRKLTLIPQMSNVASPILNPFSKLSSLIVLASARFEPVTRGWSSHAKLQPTLESGHYGGHFFRREE